VEKVLGKVEDWFRASVLAPSGDDPAAGLTAAGADADVDADADADADAGAAVLGAPVPLPAAVAAAAVPPPAAAAGVALPLSSLRTAASLQVGTAPRACSTSSVLLLKFG
jgi:hypothetical protein